jgi:hypothetical protein
VSNEAHIILVTVISRNEKGMNIGPSYSGADQGVRKWEIWLRKSGDRLLASFSTSDQPASKPSVNDRSQSSNYGSW